MIWIRLLISCIAFLSVAGSISFGLIKLANSIRCIQNPLLLLAMQKLSLVLYWVPVPFAYVYFSRISYLNGLSSYSGEFVCSTVPSMTMAFGVIGVIWLVGMTLSVLKAGIKMHRLSELLKGNVPIQAARYLDIFEECRRQKGKGRVLLGQNDLLHSPITVGPVRKQILLPPADYTDTELRMIYEHELTHISNGDLPWRIFALVTAWVHWFNPVIYRQLKELDCMQEIVCDLSIAIDNAHYTKKEYAAFLVKLTEQESVNAYTPALIENKNQTVRRIDEMARITKLNKLGKRLTRLGCACFALISILPAAVVSARTASLQEDWIRTEETELDMNEIANPYHDFTDQSIVTYSNAADDVGVTEVYADQESLETKKVDKNSPFVDIEQKLPANARQVYRYMNVQAGDSISIIIKEEDREEFPYKMGIKNKETGETTSVVVTGKSTAIYWVEVTKDGSYAIFIENCGQSTLKVRGVGYYFRKKGD